MHGIYYIYLLHISNRSSNLVLSQVVLIAIKSSLARFIQNQIIANQFIYTAFPAQHHPQSKMTHAGGVPLLLTFIIDASTAFLSILYVNRSICVQFLSSYLLVEALLSLQFREA